VRPIITLAARSKLRSTMRAFGWPVAAWPHMGLTTPGRIAAPPTLIASLRERSEPTCRWKHRRSLSLSCGCEDAPPNSAADPACKGDRGDRI